jgi:hypothetical protein
MDEQSVRKPCKDTLQPTAEQEGALALVRRRCRERYHAGRNAGRQGRRAAWQPCRASLPAARQRAQRPAIQAVRPQHRAVPAHVRHDVLPRLDRAFPACFRRGKTGATPG